MFKSFGFSPVSALLVAVAAPLAFGAPATAATAQVAATADVKGASTFIDELADRAFAVLRDKSLTRPAARAKFRGMLRENFAVQQIGAKLIRRYLPPRITQAQYQQYLSVFPDYVVGTYADRLYDYADADLRIITSRPRGTRGDIDVVTRITLPSGGQPIDAIWAVRRAPTGNRFEITNLTVSGVNLTLTQEADFDSYISRNGFDALIRFMIETGKRT